MLKKAGEEMPQSGEQEQANVLKGNQESNL